MALRTSRIVRKCAPFYAKIVRADLEGSDSDGMMRSSSARSWLHRAFFTHPSSRVVVPLSESPKRELRMRSASKVARRRQQHHHHHQKHKKQHFLPRLW